MDIYEFINNIKSDYLFFLYKNYNDIFPGCCHEASNLLCGYLNFYFSSYSFKHKFAYKYNNRYKHSYISNENDIIIDFTSWQYSNYGKLGNETPQSLLEKAKKQNQDFPININRQVYLGNLVNETKIEEWFQVINVDFYCTNEIEKFPPELFMKYCSKKRAKSIQKSLHNNQIF